MPPRYSGRVRLTPLSLLCPVVALTAASVVAGCLDPVGSVPDGPARAVDIDGTTAVVGFGRRLAVVDLSRPGAPTEVGRLATWGPFSVAIVGSRLYVAGVGGLTVADVSDPTAPAEIATLPMYGAILVAAEGDRLYVGQRACPWGTCPPGFLVFDVSFPDQPREVGRVPFLYPDAIAARGRHVVAVEQDVLVVVDCTAASAPEIVAQVALGFTARSVSMVGRLAVVSGYGQVAVVAVGDPRRPMVVASDRVPGVGWDLTVADATLGVAVGDVGLEWLDTSGCGVRPPRPGGSRMAP